MVDNKKRSAAMAALQDVRKMSRAVRLRESENPVVVSQLLNKILREALVARQGLGNSRMGKNAINEIKNVRNELITGTIDAGERQAEFITKFTTVYNEVKDIEKEESIEKRSASVKEAKEAVTSIIPKKEMVMSAIMAANPVVGYGLKIGGSIGKAVTGIGNNNSVDFESKFSNIASKLEEEEKSTEEALNNSIENNLDQNGIEILSEKLDLIREELKAYREPVERIKESTYENADSLNNIERESAESVKQQEEMNWRLKRERSESVYEGYGTNVKDLDEPVSDDNSSNTIGSKIADSVSSMFGLRGGSAAAGGALGGALGAGGLGAALLLGAKVILVAALAAGIAYALWKYRDEISKYIIDPLKNFFKELFEGGDTGGALAIEGGTEGIKNNIDSTVAKQQSIIDAADKDPEVLEAKSARDEAETRKDNLETSLGILESEWDRLVEQSNRELDEIGIISDKTREAMLENNEAQQQVKEQIENAKDEFKRLVDELRKITVDRRAYYRDNYSVEERQEIIDRRNSGTSAPTTQSNADIDVGTQGPVQDILNYIGEHESQGNYNALVYGRKGTNTPSETDLTDMTIGEVQEYQRGMYSRGHASSAVGKYQFIQKTLRNLVNQSPDIDMDTKFTPEVQDKLATALLKEKGLDAFLRGEMDPEDFASRVDDVWSSLPNEQGRSEHEGIAGNRAGNTTRGEYVSVMRRAQQRAMEPTIAEVERIPQQKPETPTEALEGPLPEEESSSNPYEDSIFKVAVRNAFDMYEQDMAERRLESDRDATSTNLNPSEIVNDNFTRLETDRRNDRSDTGPGSPTLVNNTNSRPRDNQTPNMEKPSPAREPENHDKSWRKFMFNQNVFGAPL